MVSARFGRKNQISCITTLVVYKQTNNSIMLIEKVLRHPSWSTVVGRISPAFVFRTSLLKPTCSSFNHPPRTTMSSTSTSGGEKKDQNTPMMVKRSLRKAVKNLLKDSGLDHGPKRVAYSEHISRRILDDLGILENIKGMTLYIACERLMEVDTSAILDHAFMNSIDVYVPRVLDSDSNMHFLKTHRHDTYDIVPPFGIQEPTAYMADGVTKREDVCEETETLLDVMIVPGLAFGKGGERLGRGGGYYDAFIDTYIRKRKKKPLLVGVAFDEQIVQGIPMDIHDYYMDIVVTPSNVYHRKLL